MTLLLLANARQTHAKQEPWPRSCPQRFAILVLAPRVSVVRRAQQVPAVLLAAARVPMVHPCQTRAAKSQRLVQSGTTRQVVVSAS